ncbi:hypothetical protein B0H34DRAFT_158959 [Crassisporium funariophilum]|nr:hypothetical protein B0H34DRAFT_158959 [Crassisporium funariophilum]
MNNASQSRIDDSDMLISYSVGQWTRRGGPGEFNLTTTETSNAGASAQIVFYGTNVSAWGTIGITGPAAITMYSIDQGVAATFTGVHIPATTQYQKQFFQSEQLSPATHTLVITNLIEDGVLFLDYILVGLPGPSASPTLSTAVPIIPSPTKPLSILPTISVESGISGSTSNPHVGMIVGAVLGEIVSLLVVIFVLRWRSRRKEPLDVAQHSSKFSNMLSRLRKPKLRMSPFTQSIPLAGALPNSKSNALLQDYRIQTAVPNTRNPRPDSRYQDQSPHESSMHISPVHSCSVSSVPCDMTTTDLPPNYDAI